MIILNAFSKLHPITKGAFFICAFVLVLSASNPFFSVISLCCALLFVLAGGGRAFFSSLKLSVIVILLVSIFNMLFAHYGEDVLFRIGYTDFTLQALFYGFNQGMVMAAVMLWFSALSYTQDSVDTMYLLRFMPKLAMLFSMVLGFLPRFTRKLSDIRDAQKGLHGGESVSIKERFGEGIQNLSALVTYSLESSIVTADSMNARGYKDGVILPTRFKLSARDAFYLAFITLAFSYVLYVIITKQSLFIFEPRIYVKANSVTAEIIFAAVMLLPVILEAWEVLLWKRSQSKI